MINTVDDHTTVNTNPEMYYSSVYWNNYEYVWRTVHERISGDQDTQWFRHFHQSVGKRRFKKALILCCGNGWVERELFEHGLFEEAVGVDYLEPLLDQARTSAVGLPIRYYQMDINTAVFPESGYDLIVNYAAAHHIAYIDRVFRELARLLPEDGYFVNYDYVGPHRNQYSALQWAAVHDLNTTLPQHLQQKLAYPHLPTMIHLDPTEAIHSELIIPVMQRYFTIEAHKHAGGALAYPIITHNDQFSNAPVAEQNEWSTYIMAADTAYLAAFPESSLFDYLAVRPKHTILAETAKLMLWTQEEERREQLAKPHGVYYTHVAEEEVKAEDSLAESEQALLAERHWSQETISNLVKEKNWLQQRTHELEQEIQRLRSNLIVKMMRGIRQMISRKG